MKKQVYSIIGIVVVAVAAGVGIILLTSFSAPREDVENLSNKQTIELPSPSTESEVSVEEAIFSRTSVRSFADAPLNQREVGQLLWSAAGKTVDGVTGATRAYPSAGGIYPLETYLVAGEVENLAPGVYRYDWANHELIKIVSGDQRGDLTRAALGQRIIADAPATLVLTGDTARTGRRYGSRGEDRYVPMEAGGAGQNIHLQAETLNLGTVIIGAFDDNQVQSALGGIDELPLYIMPVGHK